MDDFRFEQLDIWMGGNRRSVFECANILHIFQRRKIITSEERLSIYPDLIALSKKITNFRKSLK
jgi:hypothetical protein